MGFALPFEVQIPDEVRVRQGGRDRRREECVNTGLCRLAHAVLRSIAKAATSPPNVAPS
jgi:hypothetical protein